MTITLQEGKTYRTRDGRKIGPVYPDRSFAVPAFIEAEGDGRGWSEAGWPLGSGQPSDETLVEEWVEPADEPCPAQIAVEGASVEDDGFRTVEPALPDIKTEIADEAKRIVSGARRGAYGKPEDNFERIARYWDAYFKNTGRDIAVTAADVSPLMRLVKEARLNETPNHKDSFVDLVGYTLTGAEVNGVKVDA